LGLNVIGKGDIYSSLSDFVAGEVLSDYNCETCGKKEETLKRMCLGKLSNTIIVHLKRFELNYDTFRREKVNDRLEFPLDLDLFPYSIEGMEGASGTSIFCL
jgi:ubiquitin C-terminal hydrolase